MSRSPAVLLVVGEDHGSESLANELELDGYRVRRATDRPELRSRCVPGHVDLIILKPASDQGASLRALRALRAGELAPEVRVETRVLWISTSGEIAEVLRAFEAGADDVLRADFAYAELLARLRALMRRTLTRGPAVIHYDALELDIRAHKAKFGSTSLSLSPLEYALLVHLAQEPARVFTKEELLRDVWDIRTKVPTRTLDSHASRLRRKLALGGADGWVVAVWGVGYRLAPEGHGELHVLPEARSA
jgi:DNA-binding response OmpR family regulator